MQYLLQNLDDLTVPPSMKDWKNTGIREVDSECADNIKTLVPVHKVNTFPSGILTKWQKYYYETKTSTKQKKLKNRGQQQKSK